MQTLLFKLLRVLFLSFFFLICLHASVASPIAIDINSTINGELTSESETSPNSHNASEYYTFTLTEDKNISISVESDIYYKIYLLDNNGTVIKEASKYDYNNKRIIATLPQGTYKIDVTTVFNDSYSSFILAFKENIIETQSINLETILDGEWTNNSGLSPRSQKYSNYYTFVLTEKTDVVIDLESYSPSLYLLDSNYNVIDSATYYMGGHTKIVRTLEAGSYIMDVTSSNYNNTGIYTLRFKKNIIEKIEIDLNSTVEGNWNLSSGISTHSKGYTQYYTFTLSEAKNLFIGVDSNKNHNIYLLDENNSVIKRTFSGANMFINLDAGNYMIDVSLGNTYQNGTYTLIFKENIIENSSIELNSSIQGSWNSTSGLTNNGNAYAHYYTFTLNERKDIVISILGDNSRCKLLDKDGNHFVFDPISVYGKRMVGTLEAGTYIINATQNVKKEESYTVSLYENIIKNQEIVLNSKVKGRWLDTDGISSHTNRKVKRFTFHLEKRTEVSIDLNSSKEYARIILKNVDTDRMIGMTLYTRGVVTLDAGKYYIDVTYLDDVSENKINTFVLHIKENIIEKKSIIFDTPTKGEWTIDSGFSKEGHYINQYTFSLAEKTTVFITLKSENSKFIKLGWANTYGDKFSNIYLVKELDKGTYTFDVGISEWNKPYKIGNYELLIEANVKPALPIKNLNTELINAYNSVIKWEKGSSDTVGYKIYLNDKLVADVNTSKSSYTLNGLDPNSEYSYSVIAYNSAGESKAVSGSFKTKEDDYAWLIPVQHNILN